MEEGLAAEHASELLRHALEHLLDGSRVADEVDSHLETLGGNVADRGLDVVGDPFDEVRGVLVLHVEQLLVHLLGRHAATEHGGGSEVATVAGVGSAHHVLCVEHLLGELGHGQCAVLLRATRGQGREANHEEMETREGHNVHSELAEIGVELSRETERAGHARHDSGHKVVKIAEGGGGQLQGTEANIVQSLVVNAKHLVGVLDKLVHRERGVVRLHHSVRHLRGGHDGEGQHNAVGVLLANLGD
mmetsp:Transcript_43691/g.64125  ORF Transcript_43691/g.64125 Transcript_43691/m.64125 type:complete len:246 (+) Transcript_43691:285-1022(+)